jgi:D-glycero-D-manno-heptose 1,7-bisphosphate phosphatase
VTAETRILSPGVLIDRDGTLNRDVGYVGHWEDFRWLDGAPEALLSLKKAGLPIAVITNQSGVAKGFYLEEDVSRLHERVNQDLFSRVQVKIDGFYVCPHHPRDGCQCRKPSPFMLRKAAEDLGLDLSRSYMVGDKLLDYQAGINAGVRLSLLVRTGYGQGQEALLPAGAVVADDVAEAARLILSDLAS